MWRILTSSGTLLRQQLPSAPLDKLDASCTSKSQNHDLFIAIGVLFKENTLHHIFEHHIQACVSSSSKVPKLSTHRAAKWSASLLTTLLLCVTAMAPACGASRLAYNLVCTKRQKGKRTTDEQAGRLEKGKLPNGQRSSDTTNGEKKKTLPRHPSLLPLPVQKSLRPLAAVRLPEKIKDG